MEVKIEILIPILVVLALLTIALIVIFCRFYVCYRIFKNKHRYSKLGSPGQTKFQRHPKLPEFKAVPHTLQINQKQQFSKYQEIRDTNRKFLNNNELFKPMYSQSDEQSFSFLTPAKVERYAKAAGVNPSGLFHFDDRQSVKSSEASSSQNTDSGSMSSDLTTSPSFPGGKLTSKSKYRFKSEPILNKNYDTTSTNIEKFNETGRRTSLKPKSKAISVCKPANGRIEFSLLYDADERSLTVNLVQLVEIILKPEIFLGVLDVYNKGEYQQSASRVHLMRDTEDVLHLSDYANTAFLLYVTLFPKRRFSRHTNVVFGESNIVFNEKFTISGYTLEQLSHHYLCIHALCKFGRDGEPIVLGEVKVPMKRMQTCQVLPFMANLSQPEEELVLQSYLKVATTDLGFLEIYLSFNPIAQTLVVKIIQATGLPKLGMTGNPNVSVKTALYFCNARIAKKTSSIQKRQRNPAFNEMFEFQLSKDRISECDVLFEIRHHGPMYRSVIGYVIVGNSAGGEGTKQWRQLLDFSYHEKVYKIMPNKPVGLN